MKFKSEATSWFSNTGRKEIWKYNIPSRWPRRVASLTHWLKLSQTLNPDPRGFIHLFELLTTIWSWVFHDDHKFMLKGETKAIWLMSLASVTSILYREIYLVIHENLGVNLIFIYSWFHQLCSVLSKRSIWSFRVVTENHPFCLWILIDKLLGNRNNCLLILLLRLFIYESSWVLTIPLKLSSPIQIKTTHIHQI